MEIIRIQDVGVEAAAEKAAEILAAGGIIVYPTDTLYGIGVNALDAVALERLRELKARDRKKPLSILVPSVAHMHAHGVLNDVAAGLAERHLPGALTLVVPARGHLPQELTHNGSIGIRVPDDAFSRALAAAFPYPVTATSANLAGLPTPATVAELLTHFGPSVEQVSLFVDDGPRAGGTSSTVVLVIDDTPRVLREGAISRAELGL